MNIINLTQHNATNEQIEFGVVELQNKKEVRDLITFEKLPTKEEIDERAKKLVEICKKGTHDGQITPVAMIGGAPYFMSKLEKVLIENGVLPLYAYTKRVCKETTLPDGNVKKITVFRHEGFCSPVSLEDLTIAVNGLATYPISHPLEQFDTFIHALKSIDEGFYTKSLKKVRSSAEMFISLCKHNNEQLSATDCLYQKVVNLGCVLAAKAELLGVFE